MPQGRPFCEESEEAGVCSLSFQKKSLIFHFIVLTTRVGSFRVNDSLKALYWRVDNDEDGSTNAGDTLSVDHFGVRYMIGGGLRFGLTHANHKFTDASNAATNDSGSTTRAELRMDF